MSELIDTPSPGTERYCDPQRLIQTGMDVCRHLATIPQVELITSDGADVFAIPNFLSKRDCREIAHIINSRAIPSTLYRGNSDENFRTSCTHHFDRDDPFTADIEDYISETIGIDNTYSEIMQGQRYQVGQQYKPHYDWFPMSEAYWEVEAPRGGQRTWTALVYLNEPKEGGETAFTALGIAVPPQAGTLLMWNNIDRSGRPNRNTLHAGMPVRRGIKHIITKWYRQDAWRLLNPA